MTDLKGFPLPSTAGHDEAGRHVPPHIRAWVAAADPDSPRYNPDRTVRGSEVERDQQHKAVFAAHLDEHRRRNEPTEVVE